MGWVQQSYHLVALWVSSLDMPTLWHQLGMSLLCLT